MNFIKVTIIYIFKTPLFTKCMVVPFCEVHNLWDHCSTTLIVFALFLLNLRLCSWPGSLSHHAYMYLATGLFGLSSKTINLGVFRVRAHTRVCVCV